MDDFTKISEIKSFLELKYKKFNTPSFIENDPISIPHRFSAKKDIEISGFITSTIAWGQRKSIIKNASVFIDLMDNSPYDFIINHSESDLKRFKYVGHRTFMPEDLQYFIRSLKNIYLNYGGIEAVFNSKKSLFDGMKEFYRVFFDLDHLPRTRKHLANVSAGSAGKRLNMFLRWMVRKDRNGVDFGIWESINPSELYIPLDIHSGNIARKLEILHRRQNDWKAVEELTFFLRKLDSQDPVKFDFALFGVGVNEDF